MFVPFTYYLYHYPTGKSYYGVKYANSENDIAHPSCLWKTYFTSSERVKELIREYGTNSFHYEVRKTFDSAEKACEYEFKVLQRLNVVNDDRWLNGHDGKSFVHTEETKKRISQRQKELWSDPEYRAKFIKNLAWGKPHTEDTKRKISSSRKGKIIPTATRQKMSEAKSTKEWIITDLQGKTTQIVNLKKFCREHNLTYECMYQVMRGRASHHKGWICRQS